jgi:hypothetical protein
MIETSSTFRAPSLLSPRTANYVAALIRQGDNFDYFKWLQKVREEESQAKQIPATFTSGKIIAPEIDPPIGTTDCRRRIERDESHGAGVIEMGEVGQQRVAEFLHRTQGSEAAHRPASPPRGRVRTAPRPAAGWDGRKLRARPQA